MSLVSDKGPIEVAAIWSELLFWLHSSFVVVSSTNLIVVISSLKIVNHYQEKEDTKESTL